jgi:hypothetical protein
MMETLDKSWSEYISVYCMKKALEEQKDEISVVNGEGHTHLDADFEPFPYDGADNSEQPEDMQHLAQQLSTLFGNDNNNPSIDYLNVRGAILNEEAVDGRPLSDNGKQEIHSLGIALYELFSGGQITAEAAGFPTRSSSVPLGQTAAEMYAGSDESKFKSAKELTDAIGGGGEQLLFGNDSGSYIGSKNDDGNGTESTLDDMSAFGTNAKRRSHSNTSLNNLSQKTMVRTPSASMSVEPLKLLGLPTALCDLVSNMIDCVIGDSHGIGDPYEFISEARDDLKLMIDSPNVYLQNIDLAKAANVGLQFGSSMYGREAELQTLRECYQRSISSKCESEVAMICGTSGIGKSKLSREFARSAHQHGGSIILLSGRFDKLQSRPLNAISSAFDKYCAFLTEKDHSTAEKVATALKENLGEEMASLVTTMPNLANILGDDFNSKNSNEDDAAVDAQKRLRYLFVNL